MLKFARSKNLLWKRGEERRSVNPVCFWWHYTRDTLMMFAKVTSTISVTQEFLTTQCSLLRPCVCSLICVLRLVWPCVRCRPLLYDWLAVAAVVELHS